MKVKKRLMSVLIIVILSIMCPFVAVAHSGRTDANGGHKDNKNVSGLGSYHYHCGGYPAHLHPDGYCPYTAVFASSVKISNALPELKIGESGQAVAEVYPSDSVNKNIVWKSSNENVVTVSDNGYLVAKELGTATITASTDNNKSGSFTVKVSEVVAETITIKEKPNSLTVGDTKALHYTLLPETTSDKKVTWSSSDSKVATVDQNGNLKAIAKGSTTISLVQKDVHDEFKLLVQPVMADSIEITSNPEKLHIDDTLVLEADILPDNAEDKTIDWSVNDESMAKIEDGILVPLKTGTVTITATTVNGKTDSIEIKLYNNVVAGVVGVVGVIGAGTGIVFKKRNSKKAKDKKIIV